jgi:hypothetical protein
VRSTPHPQWLGIRAAIAPFMLFRMTKLAGSQSPAIVDSCRESMLLMPGRLIPAERYSLLSLGLPNNYMSGHFSNLPNIDGFFDACLKKRVGKSVDIVYNLIKPNLADKSLDLARPPDSPSNLVFSFRGELRSTHFLPTPLEAKVSWPLLQKDVTRNDAFMPSAPTVWAQA